eukprot:g422.t1
METAEVNEDPIDLGSPDSENSFVSGINNDEIKETPKNSDGVLDFDDILAENGKIIPESTRVKENSDGVFNFDDILAENGKIIPESTCVKDKTRPSSEKMNRDTPRGACFQWKSAVLQILPEL